MKKGKTYNSDTLIQMVRNSPAEKEEAIGFIFRHNQAKSRAFLIAKGASEITVDDLLQEAMLVLIRQLEAGRFEGKNNASVHTYFIGICKHLFMVEKRKKQSVMTLPDSYEQLDEPSILQDLEQDEQQFLLHRCLDQIGSVCRQILLLRAESPPVPWQELALEFGYKDAQNAMNKGGKCMKQLRQLFFTLRS